jgi:hypothetical protein
MSSEVHDSRPPDPNRTRAAPNPLWAITGGMAVFFVFTALIMMFA